MGERPQGNILEGWLEQLTGKGRFAKDVRMGMEFPETARPADDSYRK
jgi:hypothetical protein